MQFRKFADGQQFYFHHETTGDQERDRHHEKHYHNLFELYFISGGSCNYFIDHKSYRLIPGDLVLIPEGVIHNTEYKNSQHSRILINCSRRFIPASVMPLLPPKTYLYRNPSLINELFRIFDMIEKEYLLNDPLSEEMLSSYMNMLFILLARNKEGCISVDDGNEYIARAVAYLQKNLSSEVSLPEIAGLCSVSPEHFSRMFKKETGFGFCEYVNLLRLQKAEAMLKQPNSGSIADVALACGFNDSNYFSVKFRKHYGISPKKLQQKYRKK
ncbi:MAG: helix-turn-helix transcriptional regulator [Clostridia bacterium]|nr:helix-turn-helix transcriptional regulator [Clostridia bacterium]